MSAAKNTKPAPLGRGLLPFLGTPMLPISLKTAPNQTNAAEKERKGTQTLPITWLQPGEYQPRRKSDDEAIGELANPIRERGVIQPLWCAP